MTSTANECRCTMPLKFAGMACVAVFNSYAADDSRAIQLEEAATGMPVATASTCLADRWHVGEGEVLIKEYNENTGVLAALIAAGIVEAPHAHLDVAFGIERVPSGEDADRYVAVCKLTAAALEASANMMAACQ